jgi:hypothetical protein
MLVERYRMGILDASTFIVLCSVTLSYVHEAPISCGQPRSVGDLRCLCLCLSPESGNSKQRTLAQVGFVHLGACFWVPRVLC